MTAVGIDIGGTKIAGGLIDEGGSVLAHERIATPKGGAGAVLDAVAGLIATLSPAPAEGHPLTVGIGVAGFTDADRSAVAFAPNLGWRNVELAAPLRERSGARVVVVENDANAAAWAEARFGAGVGSSCLLCVTVGTGVGGGLVVGNRLLRGGAGMAGELGHLPVVAGGILCGCGQYGCWEQYASGSALQRRGRDLVLGPGPDAAALRAACDGDPARLQATTVGELAGAGDPASVGLVAELGEWLGTGLAGLAAVLDPDCIVVGGGVAELAGLLLDPARRVFARQVPAGAYRPLAPIRAAQLGNRAGMVGAADLARAELLRA